MCIVDPCPIPIRRQSGLSLIELVVFIAVVGVGVTGILSVINLTTASSSDPLIRKQALAIAESLLEEIQLQPFTWCDPSDPAVSTATGPAECALQENLGPEGEQARESTDSPFNNVNDYHGLSTGIVHLGTNVPVAGLEQYRASVAITPEALGPATSSDSLRIDVHVSAPGNTFVTLTGYRLRYAPNSP